MGQFTFLSRQAPEFYIFGVDDPALHAKDMQSLPAVDGLLRTCLIFAKACNDIIETNIT